MEEERVEIVVDSRERSKVKELLGKNENVVLRVETLEAGDYVVSDRCAVSLKSTVFDFCSSLTSGSGAKPHIFDELDRLKSAYEIPVLIVNGIISFDFANGKTFAFRRIVRRGREIYAKVDLHRHPSSVLGAIATIARSGVAVLRTASEYEAAQLIYRLAWQEQIGSSRPLRIQRAKKEGLTIEERQRLIVESLAEGIGPVLAENLLKKFGTVRRIVNATEEELKGVEGIGEERARRIISAVTSEYKPGDG